MKLDKIKFAMLVAIMIDKDAPLSMDELVDIDALIDIAIPTQPVGVVSARDVNELLAQIINPDGFIPAIKAYRSITGLGLKESKEAIERYRRLPDFPLKQA